MKLILAFLLGAFIALALAADPPLLPSVLRTIDGHEYKGVTLRSATLESVQIMHDDGTASIAFSNLPESLRAAFGYDPAKVAAYKQQLAEQARAQVEAKNARWKAQQMQSQKTIREVETDQRSFIGKKFVLTGRLDLSTYFNYGYSDAQNSHYSFALTDAANNRAQLYGLRDFSGEALRKKLLAAKGPLVGSFIVTIRAERFDADSSELIVELLADLE